MTAVPPRGSNPPFINRDKKIHPEGCIPLSGRDDRIRPPASLSLACCLLAAPLCGRLRTTAYSRIHRILSLTAVPPRGSNPLLSVKIRQQKQGINPTFVVYGRDDRIRTCGLCVPNATLYQTEPHPGGIEYNSTTR